MVPHKAPTESSGKTQEKDQVEEMKKQLASLSEQNRQLIIENYMNSLADEKTFRLELLQSLSKISLSLEHLNQTISDGLSPASEEESPEEESPEEEVEDKESTEKKE